MREFKHDILEAWLQTRVAGFGTLDGMVRFGDGQSNPSWRVDSGARSYVIRARPMGATLPSAHAVDREFRVLSALADTGVPVPKVYALSKGDSPLGSQFYVMDFVDGTIHWNPALPDVPPRDRAAIYGAMSKTLATLHTVDVAAVGLTSFGKPGNYFERQVGRWGKQYRLSETVPLPDADWVMDWLSDNMIADDGTVCITHGDYRIDNMIFGPDCRVAAVLDWELSTLGHPLADLAYQVMVWQLPNEGQFRGLDGIDRAAMGLPSDADYVAMYCDRRGIAAPDIWPFCLVFAMFRFMAILQGVLKRGLDGSAANPYGADVMRGYVERMAKLARAEASRHG